LKPPRPQIKKWSGQLFTWAHVKVDGHMLYVRRTTAGVECWTRRPRDIYPDLRWHPIVRHFMELMRPGDELMGELYVPYQPASQVKTAIAAEDPVLQFTVFAVPSLPDHAGLGQAAVFVEKTLLLDFMHFWVRDPEAPAHEQIDEWLWHSRDFEGLVLKQRHLSEWYKVKREVDVDLIVTGVKPGEGKYYGQVGSLVCSTVEGHEVAAVSGMTDDERLTMSLTPHDQIVGRVCEVRYQRVDSGGRLRHPRFVRWRDDEKRPDQCTVGQDPDLELYWSR
jgi:hypothetical protein